MIASRHPTRRARGSLQRGMLLLEALIAILIVALGVLGTVGLYARSIQDVDDAKFRGEAALLVNTLVGQMWLADSHFTALQANFDDTMAGPGFTEFAAMVAQRLPNSKTPIVTISVGPTATSSVAVVTIEWKHPRELAAAPYRKYVVNATIGTNRVCAGAC